MINLERADYDFSSGMSRPQPLHGYEMTVAFAFDDLGDPAQETRIGIPPCIQAMTKGRLVTTDDLASQIRFREFCETELVAIEIGPIYPVRISLIDEFLIINTGVIELGHILINTIANWHRLARFAAPSIYEGLEFNREPMTNVELSQLIFQSMRTHKVHETGMPVGRQTSSADQVTTPSPRSWEQNYRHFKQSDIRGPLYKGKIQD